MIQAVVAAECAERGGVEELRACQAAVAVVVDCCVGPGVSHFGHVAQIHGIVGISVDFISLVVEVVERYIIECAECDAENRVDYRGCVAMVIAVWRHRARNGATYRAIVAVRRWHGSAPVGAMCAGAYYRSRTRRWAIAGPVAYAAIVPVVDAVVAGFTGLVVPVVIAVVTGLTGLVVAIVVTVVSGLTGLVVAIVSRF